MSAGERAPGSRALPAGVSWEEIAELFSTAIELPDGEREQLLSDAARRNPALGAEVRSLLLSHGIAGGFLEPDAAGPPLSPSLLSAIEQAPLFSPFTPDMVVGNRYRVRSLLGRGGAGEVYEAWDEELAIPVALKTLRFGPLGGEALRSLKQEAMLARAVVHPNVCRVYDLACHGDPQYGIWFLTMEVLRGETLAERLRARGRLTPEAARPLVEQMAAGLDAAHQAGVVHLDFKSGNVMLVGDSGTEQAVITDFGLARTLRSPNEDRHPPESGVGDLVGTPAYMAPEQVRGEPVGPAADIYALGIVLYELVTGELPFAHGTPIEVAQQRLEMAAPSPRLVVPDLDERWEAVIQLCLEREPRQRFARAEDVAHALAEGLKVAEASATGSLPLVHSLPAERDRFVGREPELAAIAQTIIGGARLVTLLGAGGMGKTRLTLRYGWQSLTEWPGGVWFCDLTSARDVNGIVSAVSTSLNVPLATGDPIENLGHALLGRQRCLVILDNVEQIAQQVAATVQRWSERAPSAVFLATSRVRLGAETESVIDLEPMSLGSGLELSIERAKWLRPGLELGAGEIAALREVVRLVEGIPLAIELAAARIRVMSPQQLVTGMRKRFSLLTGGRSERHETLTAAIDGSWELLAPWEKAAWAQCSVFEGGFTLPAAEAVLDLSAYSPAPWTVDVVQSLVDKSLLKTWAPAAGTSTRMSEPRFVMYVSLQEYARGKLAADGAVPSGGGGAMCVRATEERHGKWYGSFGNDAAMAALNRHGGLEKRRALVKELDNLLAASRRASVRGDGATAAAAYRAAWEGISLRGPLGAVIDLGQEILDTRLAESERASVLMTLGLAERESGRMQEARGHFEAALPTHRAQKDRRQEGLALAHLGTVHRIQGRVEEGRAHYEAALAIYREVQDRYLESVVLRDLGGLDHEQGGRIAEARAHLEESLAIAREMGNQHMVALLLGNIGNLDHQEGRVEEAQARYEAALVMHQETNDRRSEGVVLGNLGTLLYNKGLLQEGRRHFEAALTIQREVGNRRSESINLGRLAHSYMEEGRLEEARTYYETALLIHRELGDQRWEGVVLANLGSIYHRQNRIDEAREALGQGEALLRGVKTLVELPKLLCLRAELEHGQGNLSLARDLIHEAEGLAVRIGSTPESEVGRMLVKIRQALA